MIIKNEPCPHTHLTLVYASHHTDGTHTYYYKCDQCDEQFFFSDPLKEEDRFDVKFHEWNDEKWSYKQMASTRIWRYDVIWPLLFASN